MGLLGDASGRLQHDWTYNTSKIITLMLRIPVTERPDLMSVAADHGLKYSSSDGIEGWNEDVYYQFALDQVELDLEGPAEELESLCFQNIEIPSRI